MKKLIFAIAVAIAAILTPAASADDNTLMEYLVSTINSQEDSNTKAAWQAPYLTLYITIESDGCKEFNELLANDETAPYVKNIMLAEFVGDPELLEILVELEKYGMKGLRLEITDSAGVKSSMLMTMADIHAFQKSQSQPSK